MKTFFLCPLEKINMYRLYLPIIFLALYFGWCLFLLWKNKSVKKIKNELYFGIFLLIVWVIIYAFSA